MQKSKVDQRRPWFNFWPPHLAYSLDYPDEPSWWILERNMGRHDQRDAIIYLDHENMAEICRMTYSQLYASVMGLSISLREMGIKKGDRIATILPNSPAIIQSYYGIWMAGATIVPMNPMAKAAEIRKVLLSTGVRLIISARQALAEVIEARDGVDIPLVIASLGKSDQQDPPKDSYSFEGLLSYSGEPFSDLRIDPKEDLAVILYTGGTTGEPKGAMLTHRNIVVNTIQFAEWYAFEPGNETCVCVIPMSHSGGMSGVMNVPLYSGATMVVMQRANPPIVGRAVQAYGATRMFGVPTLCAALLSNPEARCYDYSTLKACRTGAAPLPAQVKKDFDTLASKEVLVEAYGLTETSPLCIANPIHRPKPCSIGIPLPDTDVKVVSLETGEEVAVNTEGELLVRGPQVMKGYLDNADATAASTQNGWFRTGDVARMDEEGYFYVVDRLKDFINASGFKVWPREVEEVLYRYPGVKLAAVIGVPDAYRGENVKAVIVPADKAKGSLDAGAIQSFCRKHLSSYKVPHIIEFRDELALSPAGKILRRVLRDEERERVKVRSER